MTGVQTCALPISILFTMIHTKFINSILLSLLFIPCYSQSQRVLDLNGDKLGSDISPTMYGIFFEDINYGADGGLYAEKIKNRSFEFPQNLMGWNIFGNVTVRNSNPAFDKNPNYVRLSPQDHLHRSTGLDNEGFFGIGIDKDEDYRFTVWARTDGAEKNSSDRKSCV